MRFSVAKYPLPYFLVYWLTEAAYLVLALLAMMAILGPFAGPFSRYHPRYRLILLATAVVVAGLSLIAASFRPISPVPIGRFGSGVYVFVALMCLLEVALFASALRVRHRNPREWSQYEFGILVGFGMLALLTFVGRLPRSLALFHITFGTQVENLFRYFPSGAFIGSAIVWLIAFWRPEPPDTRQPRDIREYEEALRWMKEQIEFVKRTVRRHGLDFKPLPVRPRH
jgi:MFS family permease